MVKDKIQCSIRLYRDQHSQVKEKAREYRLNFQKLAEILFLSFLKDDKDTIKVVERYATERRHRLEKHGFDEIERDDLLRLIETKHSPLSGFGEPDGEE